MGMKKILIPFDGTNFSTSAFEFVLSLNKISPVLVTGVFVPQVDFSNLWSYAPSAGTGGIYVPLLEDEDGEAVAKNIRHFEDLCQQNNIAYRVHKDFFDFALPELKRESLFADVMILGADFFYKQFAKSEKFDYLKEALHNARCPVLIVPEKYSFPDNNILAYDGSEDSVFAIKQFAYIFPEFADKKTLLVYAENDEEKEIPSKDLILELTSQHYIDLTFYKLQIDTKKYFKTWMADQVGSILVSGSFGRSGLSQLFKRSFVVDIIKDQQVPVFIAHK